MYFYFCNLSFPYKKLESIKEGKKVKVAQSCLTLCNSVDYTVHGILQARILERVAFPFSRGPSQPRDQTQVSHTDSLPAEPAGKPKNTGVGSLSLLQRIFPTQESNWGLLRCWRILYQLSYQGIIKEGELLNTQKVHKNSDRHFQRTAAWGIISLLPWTKLWYFCQVSRKMTLAKALGTQQIF